MAKTEKKKYPIGAEFYELYEEIGQGVSAFVRRALCVPLNEVVAVKILDFERDNIDLNNISREAQTMVLIDHPNVLKSHCSFVSDHNLWVVMPYMSGGSCLHILKAAYPDGFEEVVIATVLREVLKGLVYLHSQGHIHRDVKAGNILVDGKGATKLGDFGVSACLFDSGDRQRMRNTFVGTPCWMAPEVMEQLHGYDFKADIWSFGITALELAHGHAPFSKYPPMKVLLMTLQNAPPGLDYERDKKFSKSFKQMIASCLVKDPLKRPSARKLLKHSFFRQARSNDYILRTLLEGLPALGDRMQALKRKEEDMLAQKKIPDGKKEEMSQDEYKRGISGWNFNLDDMKAQASLIQDVDDHLSDNNFGGSSNCLSALDVQEKQPHYVSSSDAEDSDSTQNKLSRLPSANLTRSILNSLRCDKSDDDSSTAGYLSHTSSPRQFVQFENSSGEKPDSEIIKRSLECEGNNTQQGRGSSPGSNFLPDVIMPLNRTESDKLQTELQNIPTSSGDAVPLAGDDIPTDVSSQASKTSANSDDPEEKLKVPVVQQRGRFKVTSENVELQKVGMGSSPLLQKSHSTQVLTQHAGTSLSTVFSPTEASPSTPSVPYFFQLLMSALQSNICERDKILSVMKLVATDPAVLRTVDTAQMAAIEKSLLEASSERGKDLLTEFTEMQRRLISVQDELKKFKTENTQV